MKFLHQLFCEAIPYPSSRLHKSLRFRRLCAAAENDSGSFFITQSSLVLFGECALNALDAVVDAAKDVLCAGLFGERILLPHHLESRRRPSTTGDGGRGLGAGAQWPRAGCSGAVCCGGMR